ncbi:AAA family ATPase [Deinococcus koreensis]|uniref:AAA family ATPase n=1 Tax=Deinococcus koreensis TaxID=2054903 RepID=A0A2K3UZX7_9DEIO|nr:ATP-binding protein [Deinococcus koreensis]PNY82087.1 AAA family ATPase [Deinococcus koreensis]
MSTLILLCGLPGSGKTTCARRLEAQGAVRLASDDWMVPLFGQHMERAVFDARLAVVRELQWAVAAQILRAGLDVVLDEGFWRRAERDGVRAQASALGVEVRLLYFDVPLPELRQRLQRRNAALAPGTFEIDDAALDLFLTRFEPPGADEGAVTVAGTAVPVPEN